MLMNGNEIIFSYFEDLNLKVWLMEEWRASGGKQARDPQFRLHLVEQLGNIKQLLK